MIPYVEYPAQGEHKATVIWLHGLGDSGEGFLPIAPELKIPEDLGVRFVFPHAPEQAVTINGGMKMRAWYDIKSMDLENRADETGVRASTKLIENLLQAELDKGIPAEKIVLAGFSQGGVIALHMAPRLSHKIAGVLALSTYMCAPTKLADEATCDALNIMMAHGTQDPVVPYSAGQQAFATLEQQGYEVTWHEYPMEHQVCYEELKDIRAWLIERLSA